MANQGYVVAQIGTADLAIPIVGASVTITTDEEKPKLIAHRETDKSGKTTSVAIEAPPIDLSQEPSQEAPFSTCNIQIDHPLYYSVRVEHVQIFPERSSLQQTELIPLEEFSSGENQGITFVVTPQNL